MMSGCNPAHDETVLKSGEPEKIRFVTELGEHGVEICRLGPGGEVRVNPDWEVGEVAKKFWDAVRFNAPTAAWRVGEALCRLHAAKARGVDWQMSTSWASDMPLVVVIVRRKGAALGQPIVGDELLEVLERAVAVAEAVVRA